MINEILRIKPLCNYEKVFITFISNNKEITNSAFTINDKVRIKLKIPRYYGCINTEIIFYNESQESKILKVECDFVELINEFDVYEAYLPINKLGVGLFFYSVKCKTLFGTLYSDKIDNKTILVREKTGQKCQLSVSDFKYNQDEKHLGGVIYHIFVDRFYKGSKNNSNSTIPWDAEIPEYPEYPGAHIKNNYFYGGTLAGVSEKLEYIKSLGVNIIYLSPIFSSPSNHKYDTADYSIVDSGFGGDDSLINLIKKCNEQGIGIILDGVFNHTGSDSIYFNKFNNYDSIGAYQSKKSKFYPWYEFQKHPEKYTSWWGIEILPRINTELDECAEYFVGDGGIIEKYSKMGILGLRLDVADELSDRFIEKIKNKLESVKSPTVLYGEVWEDASNKIAYGKRKRYYLGTELDGVMNYPLREGLISFLKYSETGRLLYYLCDIIDNTPKRILDMQMNLLSSHDTVRIITALGGIEPNGISNSELVHLRMSKMEYLYARALLMMAYTALATLPGIPSIYYADEVGLEGYSDPFNRRPYPWGHEDKVILRHFQKLGEIRNKHSVYRDGDFELSYLDNNVLIFKRIAKKYLYMTVLNRGSEKLNITFSNSSDALISNKKSYSFTLDALESEVFRVIKNTTVIF